MFGQGEIMSEIIGSASLLLFMVSIMILLFSIIKKEEKEKKDKKTIEDQRESDWLQNVFALAKQSKIVEFIILKDYEDAYFRIILFDAGRKYGEMFDSHGKSWDIALKEAFKKQGLRVHEVVISDEDAFCLRLLYS
jgi:predicted hydrocarbon binding protein